MDQVLRDYLVAEHQDKKNKPLDLSGWEDYKPEVGTHASALWCCGLNMASLQDIPQQENCSDCGVVRVRHHFSRPSKLLNSRLQFTSMVAECLSRPDAALDYEQENMMVCKPTARLPTH